MKIAIIYDSITGNTKKIAEAIKEACNEHEVIFGDMDTDINEADLVFVGSWTDKGNCSQKVKEKLEKMNYKKIAIFGTAGFGGSAEYFENLYQRIKQCIPQTNEILGHFYCQGKMPLTVKDRYVKMITEHPEDKKLQVSLENFEKALTHPDTKDVENAKEFAKEMIKRCV